MGGQPQVAGFSGVIFDFDGVLIDSEGIAHHAWLAAMGDTAPTGLTHERLMSGASGMTVNMMLDWLREDYGWEPAEGFAEDLERRFAAAFGPETLVEGAAQTLAALRKRGIPIALATNSGHDEMIFKLEQVGLTELFGGHAYDPTFVAGRAKPEPDLYRHAAEALGLEPAACLVIEDSLVGARAALRAGCTVWGLTATHHDPALGAALLELGASRLLGSHAELQAALGLN